MLSYLFYLPIFYVLCQNSTIKVLLMKIFFHIPLNFFFATAGTALVLCCCYKRLDVLWPVRVGALTFAECFSV